MSRASAPRTSPTMMRSGRSRSVERTRSARVTTPALVRSATQSGAAHCSSRVSSMRMTRSSSRRDLGKERVGERRLAGAGAAGDQEIALLDDRALEGLGLERREDAVGDVIVERIDLHRRLADGEAGRRRDRRQDALEALARLGQLGADDRVLGMHFQPDVGGDEADDPLHLRGTQPRSGVAPAFAQAGRAARRRRD